MLSINAIKHLIYYIASFYVAIFIVAYFFASHLIFLPPPPGYTDNFSIIKMQTADHHYIAAIYLKNPQAKYTVLISHGNAEDIGYMLPFLQKWREHGFSVFAYDYAGYGLSDGAPNEKTVYNNVTYAYDYLTNHLHIAPENIIAYGRSVGTAVNIELATKHKLAGIISEGTFLTAFRVVTKIPLLPFDQFKNIDKIANINTPILFIHGENDSIVPFWQGRKIYDLAKQPKYHYWVKGAGHNDLFWVAGETNYFTAIQKFVATLK